MFYVHYCVTSFISIFQCLRIRRIKFAQKNVSLLVNLHDLKSILNIADRKIEIESSNDIKVEIKIINQCRLISRILFDGCANTLPHNALGLQSSLRINQV